MPKLFTLIQARAALPLVAQIARDIERFVTEFEGTDLVAAITDGNLDYEDLSKSQIQQFEAANDKFKALVAELDEIGVEIKGLKPALIDFRSLREGEEVYLCWVSGEPDITHWHTLEGGFGTRQAI